MGPVLLLDVRSVVLVAGPTPGKGDLVVEAVVVEVGVDELRSVVGVDAQDREREALGDIRDRVDDVDRSLVRHGSVHGPSRGHVSHGQGEAELAEVVAAFVADQIDLHEPRLILVPFRPRPDRDLRFQ